MELTILMPCLNEALTIHTCVVKARSYLERQNIDGEILVADNGSTDESRALAQKAGARVVQIPNRGYGAALRGGIEASRGKYVIMADADDSYDFTDLDAFLNKLREGVHLVMGNRFKGGISPGAMPLLNRYLGNPVLSFLGRRLFAPGVGDFHCGLRGFDRDAIIGLRLKASGMEFASEMVVKASLAHLQIAEVPTKLSPDGRDRAPHLRPWRDGWRHLRFMLLRSPRWLFLYPGSFLAFICTGAMIALEIEPIRIAGFLTLDINALLYFAVGMIIGVQVTFFGLFAIALAHKLQLQSARGFTARLLRVASLEAFIFFGATISMVGVSGALYAIVAWGQTSFGPLIPSEMMRLTIPSVTALAVGAQMIFGGFLLSFVESD